jgi:probable HAF family extracellular repeat protein
MTIHKKVSYIPKRTLLEQRNVLRYPCYRSFKKLWYDLAERFTTNLQLLVFRAALVLSLLLTISWLLIPQHHNVSASSIQEPRFQLVELSPLPGEKDSFAACINNKGDIVGSSGHRPVMWRNGKIEALPIPRNADSASAGYINDLGTVAGNLDYGHNVWHAAMWENGKCRDLGTLGGTRSEAKAINNRNQVVGFSGTKNNKTYLRAFLYSDHRMTDLGTLGGEDSDASAINDLGDIVGTASTAEGQSHVVLWRGEQSKRQGKPDDLSRAIPNFSYATAISNSGIIAGGIEEESSPKVWPCFQFERNRLHVFRPPTGYVHVGISSMNQHGVMVGAYNKSSAVPNPDYRPCIIISEKVLDLNTLIKSKTDLVLLEPSHINDRGQIVGFGKRNGIVRAFLLNPLPNT